MSCELRSLSVKSNVDDLETIRKTGYRKGPRHQRGYSITQRQSSRSIQEIRWKRVHPALVSTFGGAFPDPKTRGLPFWDNSHRPTCPSCMHLTHRVPCAPCVPCHWKLHGLARLVRASPAPTFRPSSSLSMPLKCPLQARVPPTLSTSPTPCQPACQIILQAPVPNVEAC